MYVWVTYGNFGPVNTLLVISRSPGDRQDLPRIPSPLPSPPPDTAHISLLAIYLTGLLPPGVIAAVVFVLICLLVVMVRYMYRHKGTYHTNEAKGTEFAESADAALKNDPALQEAVDESKKEYFI
uniref:Glycophorin C (Gerbich blood group) n=1 Tax=Accipiter nisus TaxID=211598 RepID=A0A8B9MBL2_9AVES